MRYLAKMCQLTGLLIVLGIMSASAQASTVKQQPCSAGDCTTRLLSYYYVESSTLKPQQNQNIQLAAKKKKRSYGFPSRRKATGNNVFIFDPRIARWAAYNKQGKLIKTGKASGGKNYCRDIGRSCRTPVGAFRVYSKGSASCRSSRYPVGRGGAPMPYCMFFRGNYAIHGSPNVPRYNASHGCIRVLPSAARWLSKNFMYRGTTVIVRPYR